MPKTSLAVGYHNEQYVMVNTLKDMVIILKDMVIMVIIFKELTD